MFFLDSYCLLSAICFIFVFLLASVLFLIKRVHQLKSQISELTTENTKMLDDINKTDKNPLGRLFSETAKTITLAVAKNGKITQVNDSFLELLGYTKKQLVGKQLYGLLMPKISPREPLEMNIINRIFQNPELYTEHETEFFTKDGKKVWISWTNRILKDKNGKPTELQSVGLDITPRKNLEEQLQFIAFKDPQTGVLNHLSLMEAGTRELKRSIRYKHSLSVLAFRLLSLDKDLPSLKVESLLKKVVSLCRQTIRDVDYFGRIGEAEFILLLPETPEENVPFLEKRLKEKISDYNQKNPKLPIQVSFGKSAYTEKTRSIDELISKALSNIKKEK